MPEVAGGVAIKGPLSAIELVGDGQTGRSKPAQWGLFLSFAIVIPLVTVVSTHIWLRTAYSTNVFHLQGFLDQYGSGIYRYRILGRELLLAIYHVLLRHGHDLPLAVAADPQATRYFYASYVLLNGACLFLSNLVLLILLWNYRTGMSDLRCAFYFFTWLVLALSTYTVTPYDQLAYALMLVAFLVVRARPIWLAYVAIGTVAILGGLTRETEFLVSPALWSVAIFTKGKTSRRFAAMGYVHIALFAACYIALRIVVPGTPAIAQGLSLGGGRVAFPALLVMSVIVYIGLALFSREYPGYKPGVMFLGLASPYVVTVLLSGAFWELRLIVPIVLCQLFIYTQLGDLDRADRTLVQVTPDARSVSF
jgi:hypothetical protein